MGHPYVVIQEWKIVLRGLDAHEVIFEWPNKKPASIWQKKGFGCGPPDRQWTNIVLGAWLVVSPWGLGYSESLGLMWNEVITGLLIIAFAGWALGEEQASGPLAKSKRQ